MVNYKISFSFTLSQIDILPRKWSFLIKLTNQTTKNLWKNLRIFLETIRNLINYLILRAQQQLLEKPWTKGPRDKDRKVNSKRLLLIYHFHYKWVKRICKQSKNQKKRKHMFHPKVALKLTKVGSKKGLASQFKY